MRFFKFPKNRIQVKNRPAIAIVVGVIVLVVLIGLAVRGAAVRRANEAALLNAEKKVPVEVMAVSRGTIETFARTSGQISPVQQVNVISKAAGKILQVYVQSGDPVNKGAVLAELEGVEVDLQVEQAASSLSALQTTYSNLLTNKERMDSLYQEGIISQKDWEDFNLQVKNTEAQVKQLEIALSLARTQQDNLRVKSPLNGVVTSVAVETGNSLSPGMPVLTVANLNQVYAQAAVSEKLVNRFKVGDQVEVTVRALEDSLFKGKVESIDLSPGQTKLYPLKILLDNKDGLLKPGMFAEVQLRNEFRDDVIVVPFQAVIDTKTEQFVFVHSEGKSVKKPVKPGLSDGEKIEIKEGLTEGEQLIIVGQNFLNDGDPVEVRNGGEAQ